MRPWVIRGGQRNRLVDVFLSEQVTGVGYATIGDARDLESSDIANHLVEEGTSRNVALHTRMFMSFLREVQVDDDVLMPDTPDVIIGRVAGRTTSSPTYRPSATDSDGRSHGSHVATSMSCQAIIARSICHASR